VEAVVGGSDMAGVVETFQIDFIEAAVAEQCDGNELHLHEVTYGGVQRANIAAYNIVEYGAAKPEIHIEANKVKPTIPGCTFDTIAEMWREHCEWSEEFGMMVGCW
jgi:hypothetical protein